MPRSQPHLRRYGGQLAASLAAALIVTTAAWAQPGGGGGASRQDLQRQEKFNQLQQLGVDNRLRANEDIPFNQRALIDFGGYVSAQYISLDDNQHNNHGFWEPELDLYFRYNLDAANEFFVRGAVSYQDFNPGDSFEGRGDEWINPDVARGYYRFDLAKYEAAYHGKTLPYNVTFQAGRDLVYWADGLVLGSVLDGGIVDVSWHNLSVEFIAGVTPVRTVDFDTSRPSFDHNTRRGFYGALASYNVNTENLGNHKPFVYFVTQRDYNSHDSLDQGNIHTGFCYNSYYVGAGTTGNFGDHLLYGAEFAYEGGHTLSNSFRVNGFSLEQLQQTYDQIQAMAADFRIDYLLNDRRDTRFGAEVVLAGGDPDRQFTNTTFAGNTPHTHDNAFNAFGLINTGLAFAPEVSNLAAFRFGAATYPIPDADTFHRMQVGFDFFVYNKLQKDRAITEKTINGKHYLGVEPDVYMTWQISSDVTLAVRYGIFFPSDALLANGFNRQFVYTGLTFAF
jgi:hypothetical protein